MSFIGTRSDNENILSLGDRGTLFDNFESVGYSGRFPVNKPSLTILPVLVKSTSKHRKSVVEKAGKLATHADGSGLVG